jgi:tetratricopeptide (TPR) repeat protein/transcriptional regulator with XRE-family HTH domain
LVQKKHPSQKEIKQMTLTESDLFSFGVLLKALRKRRHFTQQQLAEAIGVHRSAIVRWEQGDYLPKSKAMILELARHLHLDDQESRQLLEVSLTALAPPWSVPFPRNLFFTGREEILEALHTQLGINQAVALTHSSALHGLGGVGKTQIVLEYAYRHALEYSAVFWIGAETVEQIMASLLHIAKVLQLPERNEKDQQRGVAAVQRWLSTHSQWLLIWDNVEDLAVLDRFLPSFRQGAILITTRRQALGTVAQSMDLLPMERMEGMLFLLRRAKMLGPEATGEQIQHLTTSKPGEYAAAEELVTTMGGLPLALDQAGAYLEETQCGLLAYLDLFRTRRITLLQQRGEGARDHPASVTTTFRLSITMTAQRHPAVWDLLRVCALLQPDAIPEELFRQGAEHLGVTLEAICRDRLEWNQVVAVAYSYSLLSRQPEEQTLSLHRLVQTVLLDALSPSEQEQWSRRVIGALDAVFPDVLPETEHAARRQAERLLPHTLLCLRRAGAALESLMLASLAYKAAQYLRECGQYAEAEPLSLRALSIREQILGPGHPDVATSLNYLAVLFWRQGKYIQAEPLLQRTLSIREQVLGSDHPEVARVLNNLAVLYWEQGKYVESEPLHQRALSAREQSLGPGHPLVASTLNNLAELYMEQGKDVEAEPLLRRALRIREQSLGPSHPLVASTLNGLANLSRAQSKDVETELIFQRALSIREQHLGQHHPETAQTLHDLAVFYQKQGRLSEAFSLVERALTIRLHSLGDAHPKTVATQALSAQLTQEQACPEQTLPPGNDPLQGFLDVCCELHPRNWCRVSDLWQAYEHWGEDYQERFPLSRRTFAAQLKARGCRTDRTNTARIWRGIALVKQEP